MPTVSANGTQTAVITTEHTLFNPTTNKTFFGYIDLTNMTSTDTVEVRVSLIIKAAGSYILWTGPATRTYTGVQAEPLVYIAPLPSDIGFKVTLKQTAGTGRNYDWRFYEV